MMEAQAQRRRKAAVFVDAENHADLDAPALMRQLRQFVIVEQHAYADWRNQCLDRLARELEREGFDMHHTWSGDHPGAQKDKADGRMERDIVRVFTKHPEIEVAVLVSGDAFFVNVVQRLREQGKWVVVASAPLRTSEELREIADEYVLLGKMERLIWKLYDLERMSRYVTFSFAVRKTGIEPTDLAEMIGRQLVIQKDVQRPGRGPRPEIYLNQEAYAVQTVLGAGM